MARVIFRDRIFSMTAFASGIGGESSCTIRARKGMFSCRWKYDVQIDFVPEKAPGKIVAASDAGGTVHSSEITLTESIRVQGRYGEVKEFMETHDKAAGWSGLFSEVAAEIFKNDSSLSGPKYPPVIHWP